MKIRDYIEPYFWDHKYDPWGSGMIVAGAICDVLYTLDGEIPSAAGYRPAAGLRTTADLALDPVSGENELQSELLELLTTGELQLVDLEHAARVLDRYLDLVKLAGRDY